MEDADCFGGRPVKDRLSFVQYDRGSAQRLHRGEVMTDEEERHSSRETFLEEARALGLEEHVADRESFVDDEQLRIDDRLRGEGESDHHAAGVGLHRLVDVPTNIGKGGNVLKSGVNFVFGQSKNRPIQVHVFTPCEIRVEA